MRKEMLNANEVKNVVNRLAYELIEFVEKHDPKDVVFIGIRSRGDVIAERLHRVIQEQNGNDIPIGILDITFYRDDLNRMGEFPTVEQTLIDFDIDNKHVILIDDVLYTGRTIRAAMDALFDYGRPASIKLLVLLEKGVRELPIAPDYIGVQAKIDETQFIKVELLEVDGRDSICLEER